MDGPWFGSFAQPEGKTDGSCIRIWDDFVVPIANQGVWFWSEALIGADFSRSFLLFLHNETNSWRYMHIGKRVKDISYTTTHEGLVCFQPELLNN